MLNCDLSFKCKMILSDGTSKADFEDPLVSKDMWDWDWVSVISFALSVDPSQETELL